MIAASKRIHLLGRGLILLFTAAIAWTAGAAAEPEQWTGEIELPGAKLAIFVDFTTLDDGTITATIDIPAQNAMDLALANVVYTDARIEFLIEMAGAAFSFDRNEDGATASGTLDQGGMSFPATLRRVTPEEAEAVRPKRPQTPAPPFPYSTEEVTYRNEADGITLAATLATPEGPGPHPAVVFITGSGPQDRDETIFGHKPFAVIADHLARNGIASLRADDRGVGGSGGSIANSTSRDLARDAAAGIDFLETRTEIDSDRIGLIGHSEGGLIAPIVAADREDVAFIVLLAGTGVNGREVLREQLAAVLRVSGVPEATIAAQIEAQQRLLGMLAGDATDDELREATREMVKSGAPGLPEESLEQAVNAQLQQMNSTWFRGFLEYDPKESLREVNCPVLALNGSLDVQVLPAQNLPEIKAALAESNAEDVTIRELEGLNHLFQSATSGSVAEYATIEQTIDPAVLDLVTDWIRERMMPDS
ncbi:MAG: alpha/beta hydrolase family protein [Phycisphaerales bacterium]